MIKFWYECWYKTNFSYEYLYKYINKICIKNNIEIEINSENPDIVFFNVFINSKELLQEKINSYPNAKKVLTIGEPYFIYPIFNDKKFLDDNFDLILCFDRDENDKRIRIPLWLLYYNFLDIYDRDIPGDYISIFKNNFNNDRPKLATMICRTDYSRNRVAMANLVSAIEKVDCPSIINHNHPEIEEPNGQVEAKNNFLKQYKINICPENIIQDGYVTEKLFQSLEAGCIPLYWGNLDPEPFIINKDRILFYGDDNLIDKIKLINTEEGYNNYINESFFLDTANQTIHNFLIKFELSFLELFKV